MNIIQPLIDFDQKKCNLCKLEFQKPSRLTRHLTTKTHLEKVEEYNSKNGELLTNREKKITEAKQEIENLKQTISTKDAEILELRQLNGKLQSENKDYSFIVKNKIGGKDLEKTVAKRAGLMNFDDVDYFTLAEYRQDLIKRSLGLGLEGDLAIIKELYINDFDKDQSPIKLVDFSRKKFKIRKNGVLVRVHGHRIATEYIKRIEPIFLPILKQKNNDYYELSQKYRDNHIEFVLQEAIFEEMWKQKNVHFSNLCTDKYLKVLINGITSLFGESTQ